MYIQTNKGMQAPMNWICELVGVVDDLPFESEDKFTLLPESFTMNCYVHHEV